MRKRVAIFFTGGTISMKIDPAIGAAVPVLSGKEIVDSVPGLRDVADIEIIEFGRYPGPHMTPRLMMDLSIHVREIVARNDIDGVVVTHGTDILEETAYLLDMTVDTQKPVVLTGAMRNSSELGWDGPQNLLSAVRVASESSARGLGAMVVLNETIVAAAEAAKTHTEAFDTFQSPDFGPLGVIDKGRVLIHRVPVGRGHIKTDKMVEPVFVIKMVSGSDSTLIDACLAAGAKGLVIEALGRGNVPEAAVEGIQQAISAGLPVVITSRCLRGRVFDSYGYNGGGKQLHNMGAIFAAFMTGQKARLKLALALSVTSNISEIRQLFESGNY